MKKNNLIHEFDIEHSLSNEELNALKGGVTDMLVLSSANASVDGDGHAVVCCTKSDGKD